MAKRVPVIPLESLIAQPSKRKQPPLWVQYYQAQVARIKASYNFTSEFVVGAIFVLLHTLFTGGMITIAALLPPLPSWLYVFVFIAFIPFLLIPGIHLSIAKQEWNTPILKTSSIYFIHLFFTFLISKIYLALT